MNMSSVRSSATGFLRYSRRMRLLLLGTIAISLSAGCRCHDAGSRQAKKVAIVASPISKAPASLPSPRDSGGASPESVFARFVATPSLELGERYKCARLRRRLRRLHAQVRFPTSHVLPPLGGSTALLSFVATGDSLYRYVRFRGRTRRLAPLSRPRVDKLLITLRDELEFGSLDMKALVPLLRRAYSLFVAEALPPKAKHVLIASDGLLRFVPIHAFLAPTLSGKLQFLISRVDVAYVPCAAFGRRSLVPRHLTLVVPSYGSRGHRHPVQGAATEARAVAALARGHGDPEAAFGGAVNLFQGAAATPASLFAALARPRGVVHFAGHGLADLRPGTSPELIFPDLDSGLSVRRLTQGPVRASLVVLASCTTAYVARFRGNPRGVVKSNLAEALLAGGAGAVVAASWGVKDRQSAAQMRVFYRHLHTLGPAGALALAQRDRIARLRPPHPRYWAFYAVYGALGWR